MKIKLEQEILELSPHKVVFWPKEKIMFLSDLHLGRSAAHQTLGLSLPEGAMEADLEKIYTLSQGYERILIVGDFIHHPLGLNDRVIEIVEKWIKKLPAKLDLILGNHDKILKKKLPWQIDIHDHLEIGPFLFCHEPCQHEKFVWAGHIHPLCKIGHKSEVIKLPCFAIEPKLGLLPAFGSMTGGVVIKPSREKSLYALTPNKIHLVTN